MKSLMPPFFLSELYFIGLVVGDGCLHCDFDMRKNRKATVTKKLSISLIKTDHNEKLLDSIARFLKIKWVKKKSSVNRHNFTVERKAEIDKLEKIFIQYERFFPEFNLHHLNTWLSINRLKKCLKNKRLLKTQEGKNEVSFLLETIYFSHSEGQYRNYSLLEVLNKFSFDYKTSFW